MARVDTAESAASIETAEVVAARAALEEAEAVVGLHLPSKDKGPPDADAVCLLCPQTRGAFLRAEKAAKNGPPSWCHVLCAFSKGLVIEDRVVQVNSWVGFWCRGWVEVFGMEAVVGWIVERVGETEMELSVHSLVLLLGRAHIMDALI